MANVSPFGVQCVQPATFLGESDASVLSRNGRSHHCVAFISRWLNRSSWDRGGRVHRRSFEMSKRLPLHSQGKRTASLQGGDQDEEIIVYMIDTVGAQSRWQWKLIFCGKSDAAVLSRDGHSHR